jgi:thiamine pyrophosphate-dependent acetolactate synthase large subunit-like protein
VNGGEIVARALELHGVPFLFTLCGGHISPILVESKKRGVRVVDVRHEVNAVFAADAVARLSGVPGVAAVTAGPGVTNTITAVKNAQMAQSPVVLLGGATATVLKNRGSLQDIDQMSLFRPHVKWLASAGRVRDLGPLLEEAFRVCQEGVPGPVFLECPLDLLYEEATVREWYGAGVAGKGLAAKAAAFYLGRHLDRIFRGAKGTQASASPRPTPPTAPRRQIRQAAGLLARAERPVLVVGSQTTLEVARVGEVAAAVEALGVPVYLSGMARGLLGRSHPLQRRHQRRKALREADLVMLAGVPSDFRLDYGRQVRRSAKLVSVNRSRRDLNLNRRPDLGALGDPGEFLVALAAASNSDSARINPWLKQLAERDAEREADIDRRAEAPGERVNPLALFRLLDRHLADESILVADGGDFVATCSYTVAPRGPLSWLDPGVFGTLGVGAGFALGAKLSHPEAEVWIIYGDGSAAYSLAEFDTFVRHRIPVIALVGNDASWGQIAREQVPMLGDDVGTRLRRTEYHRVAEGYGGAGLLLEDAGRVEETLLEARRIAAEGRPVLVNVLLSKSNFRQGSLSM